MLERLATGIGAFILVTNLYAQEQSHSIGIDNSVLLNMLATNQLESNILPTLSTEEKEYRVGEKLIRAKKDSTHFTMTVEDSTYFLPNDYVFPDSVKVKGRTYELKGKESFINRLRQYIIDWGKSLEGKKE